MKKATFLLACFFPLAVLAWGPTGHRAIGEIAERYLSADTRSKIASLLGGQSLALVSTYFDEIKSDPRYRKFSARHYTNYPLDKKYKEIPHNAPDIVSQIYECIRIIRSDTASKDAKAFFLKALVHLMGDLHQPLHMGKEEDKGGNSISVRWFKRPTNLHTVWDSKMIESYAMSYSELAHNAPMLTADQMKAIRKGTVVDWADESHLLARDIYASVQKGKSLGYPYMYNYFHIVRSQLSKGGVRLAYALEAAFSDRVLAI